MKTGMSTASLFPRVYTENSFDVFRENNIDTAEVFLNTFSEYRPSFIQKLIQNKQDISVHSVHPLGMQFEPQLFNKSERVKKDAEKIFKNVLKSAKALGAKYYTFHGIVAFKTVRPPIDYDFLCYRLCELCAIAKRYGIAISYENVHWSVGSFPDFFARVLDGCPELFATLDVKQALQGNTDPKEFLQAMRGRISTVHLCDLTNSGITALPGNGSFNFQNFAEQLKREKVNAPAILEVYTKDYENTTQLIKAYHYIKNLLS